MTTRLLSTDGVLAGAQSMDDDAAPAGSRTSFSGRDILEVLGQMLEAKEITESEAEAIIHKYRFKFAPKGKGSRRHYDVATAAMQRAAA